MDLSDLNRFCFLVASDNLAAENSRLHGNADKFAIGRANGL